MDTARIKNLYISNLEFISYQSNEIIHNHGSNIFYDDFYTFYTQYVKHLREVRWNNLLIEESVKKFPTIERPRLLFTVFLILFIPWIAFVAPTLNIVNYLIYSIPVIVILFTMNFFLQKRKRSKLEQVIKLCDFLKNELKRVD